MTASICPYCRSALQVPADSFVCPGCGTPHHEDCFVENDGCTVFGCSSAPADEPKLNLSGLDVTSDDHRESAVLAQQPWSLPVLPPRTPPPPPLRATHPEPPVFVYHGNSTLFATPAPSMLRSYRPTEPSLSLVCGEPKNRMTFIVLGVLLGPFGAHNFFAGYRKKAVAQLCITLLSAGFALPMTWVWAVIDISTVDTDFDGIKFTS